MQKAVELVRRAKRIVVFSGAGMSADSGIETFRGSTGTWSGIFGWLALIYGGTPFGWRMTPGYVWSRFVTDFYNPIAQAKPHEGYNALARLQNEKFGRGMSIVTMNVDGFHQASGSLTDTVFEVHGSVRRFYCGKCKQPMKLQEPLTTETVSCSCGGYARPAVTLFLESLPQDQWGGAISCVRNLEEGDVMLIVGTSSVVYPAASLPAMAKEKGAKLIEVNPSDKTPLSDITDLHIQSGAEKALTELVDIVLIEYSGDDVACSS